MLQKSTKVERTCRQCGQSFFVFPSVVGRGQGLYCSPPCVYADRINRRAVDPAIRFWAGVEKTETCWLWTGYIRKNDGYGLFFDGKRQVLVHRFAYELLVGPIPSGLDLDHVRARGCTHRNCVRPDHLEPVTPWENMRRGDAPAAVNLRKTHCKRGHEFSADNTRISKNGKRHCRICLSMLRREYRHRQKVRHDEIHDSYPNTSRTE